jgi:hypothetical protein
MFTAVCPVSETGTDPEGRGDTVVECGGVTGIVSPGTEGVVVQPRLNTNETNTRKTQKVFMNNDDLDILIHPV